MTQKKVLIVEDEAIVAMSLSRALPRLGYDVCRVFASGDEALEHYDEVKPDIILMDIHLVGTLDGIQTAERIRLRDNLPIIFMTGYDINEIRERTVHIPNTAYAGKPVGIVTLANVIASMLSKPGS